MFNGEEFEDDRIISEYLTIVTVPEHVRLNGPYCARLEVKAPEQDPQDNSEQREWLRNWNWEGCGVLRAFKAMTQAEKDQ